jgi:hypothetical protein
MRPRCSHGKSRATGGEGVLTARSDRPDALDHLFTERLGLRPALILGTDCQAAEAQEASSACGRKDRPRRERYQECTPARIVRLRRQLSELVLITRFNLARLGDIDFRYWDVEGTPVLTEPTPSGGLTCLPFDTDPPRDFWLNSVFRNGIAIDLAAFTRLCARY